jgi:hypothetical protein
MTEFGNHIFPWEELWNTSYLLFYLFGQ